MSWFSKLFKKEEKLEPIDLGQLKVDFHSHLIPAIDDGSKDMEDSLTMLRRFKEWRYQKVITTPHVMSDFYRNSPETILNGKEDVLKELQKQNIELEFEAAAEYYLDETLEAKIKAKELLTFGDNYVLFELPFISEPPNLASAIFEMQTNGYKPILAHPERYGFWYKDFENYHEMKNKGVHLQLNILSFIGHYSPETQKIAERLVDEGLVSFLGTDCHNQVHQELIEIARRKPYVHKLIESGKLLNHTL
ncbi:MAG: CpsB/CapC family capsule biosynthesis tyrosine phosphatase [Vicingaceae bacterium]